MGSVLGTCSPEMKKTQLRPHWGEGLHNPVVTNPNCCREGKTMMKGGDCGSLHQKGCHFWQEFSRNEGACLKPNPQGDGMRRWGLWEVLRS